MVLDGRIQATALDSTMLDYWLQKEPSLAGKIRIIATLGPNPSPPIVASPSLPDEMQQQLRQLLLNLHQSPKGKAILAASNVKRFTAVPDQTYDSLYEMSQHPL